MFSTLFSDNETIEWAMKLSNSGDSVDVELTYDESPLVHIHTSEVRKQLRHYLYFIGFADGRIAAKGLLRVQVNASTSEMLPWVGFGLEYWQALRQRMITAIHGLREAWEGS